MARYAKLPCTCGSERYYWQNTGAGENPFCGDCHRLLDVHETGIDAISDGWCAFFALFPLVVVIVAIVVVWLVYLRPM